jgi:hypothetical protein
MSKSVDFLSKNFVNHQNLMSMAKTIAKKLKLNINEKGEDEIALFDSEGETIKLQFLTLKNFNKLKNDEIYLKGYGNNFYLEIIGRDYFSVDFIREVLGHYPEILIYIDDNPPKGTDYLVFTKQQLDQHKGVDYLSLINSAG